MAGRLDEFEENQIIIREGEMNDKMFVVLDGAVALYMNYGKENEYVLGVRGKDKIFGDMSMLAEEKSMYTAVAISDVKVAWFQLNNLDDFLSGYPGSATKFLKNIARNNSLIRKNFMMLMDELDEVSDILLNKETVVKDVAKMSALSLYEKEIGYEKGHFHYIDKNLSDKQ